MLGYGQPYPALALIQVHTLTDGGQTSLDVARKIAAFVDEARETLELALYDIRLHDETADIVRGALVGAHERGVNVRLVYNLDETDERGARPGAAAAEDGAVADRVAAVRDRGDSRAGRT